MLRGLELAEQGWAPADIVRELARVRDQSGGLFTVDNLERLARSGRVEVAPMLPLSLSYDHRAIDGALGRRFLAAVIERLERGGGPSTDA